jgi:hypothetical protein
MYHMKMTPEVPMRMPIYKRAWMIDRFIRQKDRENEAMESARRKNKSSK